MLTGSLSRVFGVFGLVARSESTSLRVLLVEVGDVGALAPLASAMPPVGPRPTIPFETAKAMLREYDGFG